MKRHYSRNSLFLGVAVMGWFLLMSTFNIEGQSFQALPRGGDHQLLILDPRLVEVQRVTTKPSIKESLSDWDFLIQSNKIILPHRKAFTVLCNSREIEITGIGFRRRPVYAPLREWDLR
ncbi:MAG TPA: hypothetical protein P5186_09475, partial [Candidatus Paceibacterota bacterium]|nr:hypothetical protein [Verrucomicrobiota bacterium]HRY48265.1 hypothetical protein [Candidatus Paceibacterota bacterium]